METPFLERFESRVHSQFSTIIIVLAIPTEARSIFKFCGKFGCFAAFIPQETKKTPSEEGVCKANVFYFDINQSMMAFMEPSDNCK